jgi:hypothetical protein
MHTLDETRIEAFAGQVATEVGAALNAALVTVGDQLGLYRAMGDAQPVGTGDLAARTDTHERYVREWLNAQAAGGFVTYDAAQDTYTLPAEHALILADEASPLAMAGIFQAATAVMDGRAREPSASAAARASAGTSTTTTCSAAPSAPSAPTTACISCRSGSPRSPGSSTSSSTARGWPTSAAATAQRRS